MNHFNPVSTTVDRRGFLGTAAGGLTLAVTLSPSGGMAARDGETVLNAYVQITDENEVFIVTPGCEIGQGVYTGLPKILCEELEADWDAVQVRLATADDAFINPAKKRQSTGNSDAVIAYTDLLLSSVPEMDPDWLTTLLEERGIENLGDAASAKIDPDDKKVMPS